MSHLNIYGEAQQIGSIANIFQKVILTIQFIFIRSEIKKLTLCAVADLGFSLGGRVANSQNVCAYLFFGRKLHENERIWTPGAHPWHPPYIRHWCVTENNRTIGRWPVIS